MWLFSWAVKRHTFLGVEFMGSCYIAYFQGFMKSLVALRQFRTRWDGGFRCCGFKLSLVLSADIPETAVPIWAFRRIGGSFCGVQIVITVYWGLDWGPGFIETPIS